MPHILHAKPFDEQKLAEVQGFDCGDNEWCPELNDWIKGARDKEHSALWSIANKGNEVFLYYDETKLVGFGSLGFTSWRIPPPKGPPQEMAYIPMVAMDKQFHGGPKGVPREERYSHQIIRDLIARAKARPENVALALHVNPKNGAAIALYSHFNFQRLDEFKGMVRMILALKQP
jgi:ribosomal protein S18 acetylase RimI-like enzyme